MAVGESESTILKRVMLRLSSLGCTVFRNNQALGWVGEPQRVAKPTNVTMYPGDVLIRKARPLHAGLFKGSADLIGWRTENGIARFDSCEVKSEDGTLRPEQIVWRDNVEKSGGIAMVVRSAEEVILPPENGV